MQVSESMANSNGFYPSLYDEGDDKPMVLMKKNGDGHGITALINRQLQGEFVTQFSKISESNFGE